MGGCIPGASPQTPCESDFLGQKDGTDLVAPNL
jgi:hypothetical protein